MSAYLVAKWLHILSSTLLFGTGLGTAYFMYRAHRTRDIHVIAAVTRHVVAADWTFTLPTVVFQPLSGFYLVYLTGYALTDTWIWVSILLYLMAGACWLPVVWLQLRMRDLSQQALAGGTGLSREYWRMERIWGLLGIPAFAGLIAVFYLMTARPA